MLEAMLQPEEPRGLQAAAAAAMGTLGSSWAWEALGGEGGLLLRERLTRLLVAHLGRSALTSQQEQLAVQSLVAIAHPIGLSLLEQLGSDGVTTPVVSERLHQARALLEKAIARAR